MGRERLVTLVVLACGSIIGYFLEEFLTGESPEAKRARREATHAAD